MPFIRLVLDSSWLKLADGTYGQPMDGVNYKWDDLTFNLYDFLPPQKITELLLADRFKIMLEDIVWTDRDGFNSSIENQAFMVRLPDIQNESTYGNRKTMDGLLDIVFETYSPNVNYRTGNKMEGILVYDKNWLRMGQIRIKIQKIHWENADFTSGDFGNAAKYVMSLLIEY